MENVLYSGLIRNVRKLQNYQLFDLLQPGSKMEFNDFHFSPQPWMLDHDLLKDGEYLEFLAEGELVVQLIRRKSEEPSNQELQYLEIAVDIQLVGKEVRKEVRKLLKTLPSTFVCKEYKTMSKVRNISIIFAIYIRTGVIVDGGMDCFTITKLKNKLATIKGLSYIHKSKPTSISDYAGLQAAKDNPKKIQEVKFTSPDTWDLL